MWLFNRIVFEPQLRLCTRAWGERLGTRLERLQAWAESQGLELAAECHLARIRQVCGYCLCLDSFCIKGFVVCMFDPKQHVLNVHT